MSRTLIEEALIKAAKQVAADTTIEAAPEVTRDTQGAVGAVAIDETILGKIEDADIFVADVSIVNGDLVQLGRLANQQAKSEGRPEIAIRPTPNPNVMYELGYARKALGEKRVILVFNLATGTPETDLPFDLRMNRQVRFFSEAEATDRATTRAMLVRSFDDEIRGMSTLGPKLPLVIPPTAAEIAIEAMETNSPTAPRKIQRYWDTTIATLTANSPDLTQESDWNTRAADLNSAIERTSKLVVEFSEVAQWAKIKSDTAAALTAGFEAVLQETNIKPGVGDYHAEHW